jgi:hypothetical protein
MGNEFRNSSFEARASDITIRRNRGNAESAAANERMRLRKPELRDQIYAWFLYQGAAGATCFEASQATGIRYTTMSARISELKADRWLAPLLDRDGRKMRRKTVSGDGAAVLRAVSKAERDGVLDSRAQGALFEAASFEIRNSKFG